MEANVFLPTVAWRTYARDVILLTEETSLNPATYRISVQPIDVNELGAATAEKQIGFYFKDYVGHTYTVIDFTTTTIDVSDDFRCGVGAQSGRQGIVYKSVGDGTSPYLAPIYYRHLDKSALEYSRQAELDILWKHGISTSFAKESPLKFIDNFSNNAKNSNVIFIGDSNYDSAERLMTPLLNTLQTYKKSSGVGYFSFASGTTAIGMFNLGYSGTWVSTNIMSGGGGLEGRQAYSNTAGSEITINTNSAINYDLSKFDKIRAYYKITGNAGTVGYSINSGTYSNVVLSTTVVNNLGYFDITLPSVATTWTVKVKLVSGECTLLGGVISNTTQKGIIVHKAGHAGANSANFSTLSSTTAWKSLVQNIDPDIVFIGLTTNDFSNGVALEITMVNMLNLISNIKLAIPSASIYVISPPRLDESLIPLTSITAAQNNKMLLDICVSEKIGFISIFNEWDRYPSSYTNTLFADGIHYNADGATINSIIISSRVVPEPYYDNVNDLQRVTDNGNVTTNNILVRDIVASRGTTGVVFLNDAQDRYVYYDNGYYMPSSELYVNANNLVYNTGNANKNSVDWKTNTLRVGDDQSTNNPIHFIYGGTGSVGSARTGSFQVDHINRNLNIGSWNHLKLYTNVSNESTPDSGTLGIDIGVDGSVKVPNISGTGTRITTIDTDGVLGSLSNGTENQVVKIVGGALSFADEDGGIDESGMTANFIQKWDGTKFIDWVNPRPQTIPASTTAVWDVNQGIDANMTMTGDAYITLQNLKVSTSGTLHITKQATNYRLKLKGYTLAISRNIEWDSTGILITGNSKDDSYTWTYNGEVLTINGNKDYNRTSF